MHLATDSFEQQLNGLAGHGATMSVCDPNASLKRRKSAGRDIEDDFLIKDDDDFVVVEVRASSGKGSPRHKQGEREEESEEVGTRLLGEDVQAETQKKEVLGEGEETKENWVESIERSRDLEEGEEHHNISVTIMVIHLRNYISDHSLSVCLSMSCAVYTCTWCLNITSHRDEFNVVLNYCDD